MHRLQPLLQEAIQKKCQTRLLWEAPSAVKGPLTWRQFHRLAGRGTDDRCEPQPIPSVIVGHDKDWLSLSPYALQHWESLLLEPYSYSRDIAYVVVAPDNDAVLPRVRWFFRELSTAYEMCKLGRHSPITKVLRDGILRVGKTAKAKIGNEPVEEWFTLLGENETTDMLKLYAQVCKHHLAPHLQQVPMDKTLLDPPQENSDQPTPSPMPPPSTPDNSGSQGSSSDKGPITPKSDQEGDSSKDNLPSSGTSSSQPDSSSSHCDDEDREAPSVVVYLVEPFTLGRDQPELRRLACLALLRCYQSALAAMPEGIRSNISVQIISLESIVELNKARDRMRHSDHMRALAFNIFSQCRRLLIHSNNVKSLTGFGTAAMADHFLKNKDEKNRAPYKLYTPPYILAPTRGKVEAAEAFGKGAQDQASVLYLSYCLSEDQSWLLASATDDRGEIFETININVDIPNRSRRKKASARRVGLEKLMNFILGVMSQSVRPWRLVVGRLGRIGHGELKGWSWLLSRRNLLKASKHLKEICNQCLMMYPSAVPCILSACLVSLEPDSVLRLMPDQFTPDERFSQVSVNSQLSTPQDVSCTHILVFPTSATTQSSQTAFQEQHITADLGDDELFSPFGEDIVDDEFNDIFWGDFVAGGGQSPTGSPRRDGSPGGGSPQGCGGGGGAGGGGAGGGGGTGGGHGPGGRDGQGGGTHHKQREAAEEKTSLEYCSHVWGCTPKHSLKLLDSIQNRAVRLIDTDNLTKDLHSLEHRRRVAGLSLFYRFYHGTCSSELSQIITPKAVRTRNTREALHTHPYQVEFPTPRTSLLQHPFGSLRRCGTNCRGSTWSGKLNPNRASDPDQIPAIVIKRCAVELTPILWKLFKVSYEQGVFPATWKIGCVQPIPKKGKKLTQQTCYGDRHQHSTPHYLDNNIHDRQYGFRKHRSTGDLLAYVTRGLNRAIENHGESHVVALDISKAFDRVWHLGLLAKLAAYVEACSSDAFSINAGIPQGSVLSPTLFVLDINELLETTSNPFFADDSPLISSMEPGKPLPSQEIACRRHHHASQVNADIKKIVEWGLVNKVQFNVQKTRAATLTKKSLVSLPMVEMEGRALVESPFIRKLYTPEQQLLLLYQAQIRPSLEYCSHVWGCAPKHSLKLLDSIHNRSVN
nr:unnamed protein product [Callosobruchus analis]